MSGRSLAIIALLIAGGLTGCSTAQTSAGNFKGDQAKVASTIDALSSAASSHDTTKICTKILAPDVAARLKAAGGSCPSVVGKQLDTVDTFDVSVETVKITGATAKATVKSTSNGKNKTDTLDLVRLADGTWRIAALG
jgi:outer membrane lipoprotein SlyB